jgi:uncharacterized protein YbcV (DUF1398 family)
MDARLIVTAARATLEGTISFAEAIHELSEAGVEYYHVDYVGRLKTFYSREGHMVVTPIPYEDLPPVAEQFDSQGLLAAIHDSQKKGQKYREFTRRAMSAGVQGYFAFLRGQRVTYLGRGGEHHTEWFPSAKDHPRDTDSAETPGR